MSDMLFDVPRNKTRLQILKEQHGIETHHASGMGEALDWLAVLMPAARKFGYGVTATSNIGEIFSKVGRLVDEAGYSGYGRTEIDAVVALCRKNNIPCVL